MPPTPLNLIDLEDGRFAQTSRQELRDLIAAWQNSPQADHLVVQFHGGLVSREAATQVAEKLVEVYPASGAYPLVFIWNSDLMSLLRHNLDEIGRENVFKQIVRRVAQFVLGKITEGLLEGEMSRGETLDLVSIKQLPPDLEKLEKVLAAEEGRRPADEAALTDLSDKQENQIQKEMEKDLVIKRETSLIANGLKDAGEIEAEEKTRGLTIQGSTATLMSPSVLKEIAEESPDPATRSASLYLTLAKYGVQITRAVLKRYRNGRDHGLYTTIVEEVLRALYLDNAGILAWNLMKKDTADAFGDDPEIFGGRALLEELAAVWRDDLRVTLIGHSTGAIYIAHLLEAADKILPPQARFDIVFLAGAASFPFLNERLDVLQRRVGHIRNFGLSDPVERGYWEVPALYNASLLYMVSGLFEEDEVDMPLVGMERYFDLSGPYDRPDIAAVAALIKPEERIWAPTAGENVPAGKRSKAQKHGGMQIGDTDTLTSIRHILKEGF